VRLRPPDWLIYAGVVAVLLAGAFWMGLHGIGPAGRLAPAAPVRRQPPQAASPFDETITVRAPAVARPGAGTAFSVSSGGIWFTARHVVEGCARTAIVVGPGEGVAAEVRINPRGETAVLITQGGAPALALAPRDSIRRGMTAFHAGFPQGRPGQIESHLVSRETLVLRGRHSRRETVLAWAQSEPGNELPESLAGLSGAPALDGAGRVIGVTIAQSRRHKRVYTTTPGALRAALGRAHIEPATGALAAPIDPASYERIAANLRATLSIVPVVCLPVQAKAAPPP
jgi:serine protease Do